MRKRSLAAQRPTMRFVKAKSEEQQSRAIVFRTRAQLVNHRTDLVNALRAHLYEFGHVAPQSIGHLRCLAAIVEDKNANLPDLVRELCCALLEQVCQLAARIDMLTRGSTRCPGRLKHPDVCRPCRVSALSARWQSKLLRHRWRRSSAAAISPPSLVWFIAETGNYGQVENLNEVAWDCQKFCA